MKKHSCESQYPLESFGPAKLCALLRETHSAVSFHSSPADGSAVSSREAYAADAIQSESRNDLTALSVHRKTVSAMEADIHCWVRLHKYFPHNAD